MSITTEVQSTPAAEMMSTAASKSTYIGAATAAWGGLSASDLAAIGGLILALAGFVVNLYFKMRDDRRAQAEHTARMGQMGAYDE